MGYFLSALFMFMENMAYIIFFDSFMERKWKDGTFYCLDACCIAATFAVTVELNLRPGLCHSILSVMLIFTTTILLFRGAIVSRILSVIMVYALLYALDALFAFACTSLFQVSVADLRANEILFSVEAVLARIGAVVLVTIIKRIRQVKSQVRVEWSGLLITILFPCTAILTLLSFFSLVAEDTKSNYLIYWCIVLLVVANVVIVFLVDWMERASISKKENLALNQRMHLQAESLEALSISYASQRKLSHDFCVHIDALSALLSVYKLDEAKRYIENIQAAQTMRVLLVKSNHPVIDALLNQKASIAQKNNIDIQLEVNDLSNLQIATDDLAILLANILDNAIEACVGFQGERRITVKLVLTNELLFSVRNTCEPVEIRNNQIATTKKPIELHGYGLPNVITIIKKHDADFAIDYQNNCFQFTTIIANITR